MVQLAANVRARRMEGCQVWRILSGPAMRPALLGTKDRCLKQNVKIAEKIAQEEPFR